MNQKKEAQLFAMGDEELFAVLGNEILSGNRMGAGVSESQKSELGRNWLGGKLEQIKAATCGNELIKDLSDKGDTTALVGALPSLLGFSATTTSISVIAVLIMRIGLRRICSGDWSPKASH